MLSGFVIVQEQNASGHTGTVEQIAETALDGLKDLHAAVRKFAAMFEEA